MRGIQQKKVLGTSSNNRTSSCSYCRDVRHTAPNCPHVKLVWNSLQKGIVPLDYLTSVETHVDHRGTVGTGWQNPLSLYYINGEHWGDLFTSTTKANAMVDRRLAREKSKGTKKRRASAKICGFCGELGHTRRKCTSMEYYKVQLKKANRNFREWFYKEYVEAKGLSTGAIISFEYATGRSWTGGKSTPSETRRVQSIVTDINWDSINVFSLLPAKDIKWRDEVGGKKAESLKNIMTFFESPVLCKIPQSHNLQSINGLSIGRRNQNHEHIQCDIGVPFMSSDDTPSSPNTMTNSYYDFNTQMNVNRYGRNDGNGISNVKVVSRAKHVLPSDWIEGYTDEMEIVFSKYDMTTLQWLGITGFIDSWADGHE